MRINGVPMPDERVPQLYCRVMEAAVSTPLAEGMTQFEVITVMAFEYFAREQVEIAVVEVGLGGRLDSTNVLDPLVTAVTNVGLEHSLYLGDTIEEIAGEKAGIAKEGVTLVTGATGAALRAIEAVAARQGAPVGGGALV